MHVIVEVLRRELLLVMVKLVEENGYIFANLNY